MSFIQEKPIPRAKLVRADPDVQVGPSISSMEEMYQFLKKEIRGLRVEKSWVVTLDIMLRVLSVVEVASGSIYNVNTPLREVFLPALLQDGFCIVLAHNHPTGYAVPSQSDVRYTIALNKAAKTLNIKFNYSMILTEKGYSVIDPITAAMTMKDTDSETDKEE